MKKWGVAGFFLCILLGSGPVFGATYTVDTDHTTVGFKIRHLFSYVQGNFGEFEGNLQYEAGKPETWKVTATVQAASINTNVEARDKHLRSADFFDVEKYPTLTFKSTKVEEPTKEGGKLHGLLSIHGEGKDPWGNVRAGFTATTKINRKNFGLNWNEVLETGGVLVGDEVEITLEVEGIKKE